MSSTCILRYHVLSVGDSIESIYLTYSRSKLVWNGNFMRSLYRDSPKRKNHIEPSWTFTAVDIYKKKFSFASVSLLWQNLPAIPRAYVREIKYVLCVSIYIFYYIQAAGWNFIEIVSSHSYVSSYYCYQSWKIPLVSSGWLSDVQIGSAWAMLTFQLCRLDQTSVQFKIKSREF